MYFIFTIKVKKLHISCIFFTYIKKLLISFKYTFVDEFEVVLTSPWLLSDLLTLLQLQTLLLSYSIFQKSHSLIKYITL